MQSGENYTLKSPPYEKIEIIYIHHKESKKYITMKKWMNY